MASTNRVTERGRVSAGEACRAARLARGAALVDEVQPGKLGLVHRLAHIAREARAFVRVQLILQLSARRVVVLALCVDARGRGRGRDRGTSREATCHTRLQLMHSGVDSAVLRLGHMVFARNTRLGFTRSC